MIRRLIHAYKIAGLTTDPAALNLIKAASKWLHAGEDIEPYPRRAAEFMQAELDLCNAVRVYEKIEASL